MPRKKKKTISILLADDHAIVLDGLRVLLEAEGDLKVVGSAINGEEAVRLAKQLHPDIAIVDIKMPVMNGIEATRHIRESSPSTLILILSGRDSAHYVDQALRAGADWIISKHQDYPHVVRCIEEGTSPESAVPDFVSLARLEYELIQRVLEQCEGNKTKAAERLGLSRTGLQRRLKKAPPSE